MHARYLRVRVRVPVRVCECVCVRVQNDPRVRACLCVCVCACARARNMPSQGPTDLPRCFTRPGERLMHSFLRMRNALLSL